MSIFNNFFKVRKSTSSIEDQPTTLEQSESEEFDFSNVLTAEEAHQIADDKATYSYLDSGVLKLIFESVEEAARKHKYGISSEIGNVRLTHGEITYCINVLEKAGYTNVRIQNSSSKYVYPQVLEYGLTW